MKNRWKGHNEGQMWQKKQQKSFPYYAMATSFFYIYVMASSFFYIYAMATSFFYIYVNGY